MTCPHSEPFCEKASPKNNLFILDATAGLRSMWFNKEHPNTLYIDQRRECRPDLVINHANLDQLNTYFKLIVYDPPHLVYVTDNSLMKKRYGSLNRETWQNDIKSTAGQLWRHLEPYGILIFKWNDNNISFKKILALFPTEPLFGQTTGGSRGKRNKKSNDPRSRTKWFCFMKIPKENPN